MGHDHFFIIGAFRSGTTYLATILDEHPEICMAKPFRPEPKFFLQEHEAAGGIDYYEGKYFSHRAGESVMGEKSIGYCEIETAARRIQQWFPDAKIIMVMRDPVYRALSNYFYSVDNGLERRSVEDVFLHEAPAPAWDRKKISISPFDYVRRGFYLKNILMYEKYFDRASIRALVFEEIVGKGGAVQDLYAFLGVDDAFMPPSLDVKIHEGCADVMSVSERVIAKLRETYRRSNGELERHLGRTIGPWR